MTLETYHGKRRFKRTPEPRGHVKHARGFSYVIQKHAASHLHYDFRLELDGVLLSWAVPKGPSLDPRDKRLAMQVEDHPVEYGAFEGTIPKGEYGGGTVMLWDRGTWEPDGDPRKDYARGRLSFTLHGDKLHGKWHLVRTAGDPQGRKRWLLFKGADDEARRNDGAIVKDMPASVATGRSLDEIAADQDASWSSNRTPRQASKRAAPARIEPELATLVKEAPEGDAWLHEMKLDGYRILAHVTHGKATLMSRNGKDWTDRLGGVARAVARIGCKSAVLDGEVVALREDGVSDFQRLQNSLGEGDADLTYFVFDLLELDGRDLRGEPLEKRKARLAPLLPDRNGVVRLNDHVVGGGAKVFESACKLGLEGIVSKRRDAPYRAGRGRDWLKIKCGQRQEFVIVGWTDPKSSREHFGALLLAVKKGRSLAYVGKVGTGFTAESLASIAPKLRALSRDDSPLAHPPRERRIHWVEPKLVCEVAYSEMTDEGMLRHPSFQGLRQDKAASEIVLESADRPPAAPRKHERAKPSVSHPDKVLYPDCGVTKGEVAEYLERVADWMLPHVAGRPLMLVRCPNGIGRGSAGGGTRAFGRCFVQKHAGLRAPDGARMIDVGDDEPHMVIDDARGLVGLAQAGVLEIHTWGSRVDTLEQPDLLVFDLDPDPTVKWPAVVAAARLLHERLASLELDAFVKTTGGKGLHVCCSIEPSLDWDAAKEFTLKVAEAVVREDPAHFIATMSKARRKGKIFIDYLRNGRGATFIAPFSPRARPGAPVAMPISWDELDDVDPTSFTVRTAMKRLDALRSDPWPRPRKHKKSTSRSKG
ncbi:MAG TPA: DNA ligase D [Polyangiaceae bacterium]